MISNVRIRATISNDSPFGQSINFNWKYKIRIIFPIKLRICIYISFENIFIYIMKKLDLICVSISFENIIKSYIYYIHYRRKSRLPGVFTDHQLIMVWLWVETHVSTAICQIYLSKLKTFNWICVFDIKKWTIEQEPRFLRLESILIWYLFIR